MTNMTDHAIWVAEAMRLAGRLEEASRMCAMGLCCDDKADAARAALSSHLASPPIAGDAGWQPIETAPKDGTEVLLAEGGYVTCGFWHDGSECYGHRGEAGWFSEDDRNNLLIASNVHPSHWQPLPKPPAMAQEPRHV